MNKLYFGDNLHILREHIKDETVDLIYLDPPFNSKKAYSAFFKTPKGHVSESQLTAFDDTWHWGPEAEIEFGEILRQQNTDVAEMVLLGGRTREITHDLSGLDNEPATHDRSSTKHCPTR